MNRNYHDLWRKPCRASSRFAQSGYSIFDLIITSAVAGVLSLGAVGMNGLVQDTRISAMTNQLMGNLSLARSEAIKRGLPVSVCASTTGSECQGSREWSGGWIMFSDANGNGKLEPGESVLHVQQETAIRSLRFGAWGPGTGRWVTYETDGTTKQNGTFTLCDDRGADKARAVILLGTGRPRVSSVNSSNGPLTCS